MPMAPFDSSDSDYRAVSISAVAGLLLGLASVSAFLHPLLWLIPLLAAGVCLFALAQLRRYAPGLTGRGAAVTGLSLALVFGIAAPIHAALHRAMIDREAKRVGLLWLADVRAGKLYEAHQMTVDPEVRLPVTDNLAASYRELPKAQADYENFEKSELIRELGSLPGSVQARFYKIETYFEAGNRLRVQAVFALYDQQGQPLKQPFIRLGLHRMRNGATGETAWWVVPLEKHLHAEISSAATVHSRRPMAV